MQTKLTMCILAIAITSVMMTAQAANAEPVVNGKICSTEFCLMDYNANLAHENLLAKNGASHYFLHANYGWSFFNHNKHNPIVAH